MDFSLAELFKHLKMQTFCGYGFLVFAAMLAATAAMTIPPFVRSRYSLRKRYTTTPPPISTDNPNTETISAAHTTTHNQVSPETTPLLVAVQPRLLISQLWGAERSNFTQLPYDWSMDTTKDSRQRTTQHHLEATTPQPLSSTESTTRNYLTTPPSYFTAVNRNLEPSFSSNFNENRSGPTETTRPSLSQEKLAETITPISYVDRITNSSEHFDQHVGIKSTTMPPKSKPFHMPDYEYYDSNEIQNDRYVKAGN